ncbi:hypothetical protein MNV_1610030 [Candidatus Methanoperedens nitroreducens]|uniref:Uncharacterized protein n=1 Tax=Candidatus Methanoperedens nitratireducens TaxID=1392998 RepID=A0A284VLG3_9EURY|nr:hypothetical protein MNV_1610030 [Candidatus Methanoperedens nitroreducens]
MKVLICDYISGINVNGLSRRILMQASEHTLTFIVGVNTFSLSEICTTL